MLLLLRRHSVSTKSKLNRSLIFQFSARFTSVLSIVIGFPFFSKVPRSDAANDLALLKADGRFAPLPIAASRAVTLGGTVATVGFPDIGLQGFAPKLAKGEIASLSCQRRMTRAIFKSACRCILPVFRQNLTKYLPLCG
jgi:hypothetical protein